MVRKRILVGPEVPDVETLTSLVARLGHYFAHVGVEQILVVVAADVDIDEAANVLVDFVAPAGFDPSVGDRVNRIRESIAYLPVTADLRDQAVDCDLLLVWESAAVEREPWNEIAKGYRRNRTMFDVDWRTTRGDGIWFAEAAMVLDKGFRRFDEVEARRFRDRTSRWRGAERAYLIATGPSARTALSIDLSDGVRIACNTVVLDDELMAHVAPDIVTFADPIFHFGPSTYAHKFQLALARQARRHDFTIVTVERFAGLLRSQLPQLAERIVAVRMGGSAWTQNLDLLRELAVRPYPNVLTMLMLPLAATFARDIQLIGFDGRHPDETYFWRHGETVQLGRELEEIKTVHPGFFDLDYENYYTSHVNALEQLLRRVEQQGINVSPRTPSFMTPLRRRTRTPDLDPLTSESHPPTTPPRADVILSITPDWVDRFGHFGPWERRVRQAARDSGLEYRSLASKALVPEAESELRVFTHGTLSSEPFDPALFELELREQLALVAGTGHRVYVVFYTADVWHLPSMLAVARDHPDMLFAVNLMRAHTRIAEAHARQRSSGTADSDPSIRLLASCLEAATGTNLLVCIDTEAIAAAVEEITGVGIPTWPMISVADPDQLKREKSGSRRRHRVRLVAPIQTQRGKGLSAVLALAEGMHASLRRGRVSLAARFLAQSGDTARDLEWADRLTQLGGELIEGDLTDDQYVQMISEADIVLLPYRSDIFRTRTSGVLLDAVAAGTPIVATRGTWAGDLVERFAIGATFRDGDVDHLLTAVRWTILHRRALRRRLIHQRDAILEDFAPVRMIEFLVSAGADRRGWCPTEIAVARAGVPRARSSASSGSTSTSVSSRKSATRSAPTTANRARMRGATKPRRCNGCHGGDCRRLPVPIRRPRYRSFELQLRSASIGASSGGRRPSASTRLSSQRASSERPASSSSPRATSTTMARSHSVTWKALPISTSCGSMPPPRDGGPRRISVGASPALGDRPPVRRSVERVERPRG